MPAGAGDAAPPASSALGLPPPDAQRAALGLELIAASRALGAMEAGRSLPLAIAEALAAARLPAASRPAVQHLAYSAARRLGATRFLLAALAARPPAAPVAALAQVTLAQMLEPRRHDAVVVDQTIAAAKRDAALAPAAGFLNAVLRRFGRERERWLAAIERDEPARFDHPQWWIDALRRDHPHDWERILRLANEPPPMTLRVNRRRSARDDYLARLAAAGIEAEPIGEAGVVLAEPRDVAALPGFAEGLVSVQDWGAQLAAPLLDARDGMRVLDACAAPGGKTAHLAELADVELLAIDVDRARLTRVDDNLARLGLGPVPAPAPATSGPRVTTLAADAGDPSGWWDGRPFDRILVDAPCSASGIVRRHPDVRWLRRRGDAATLSRAQSRLLEALWPLLAPGGKMLYATCSLFSAENAGSVERFAARTPDCLRLDQRQLLPADEPGRRHDGFYYALLQKNP